MSKLLNALGAIGAILVLIGFITLDSQGKAGTVASVLAAVGLVLVFIWIETEGRQWA
jgi:uncharacterized membrane protein